MNKASITPALRDIRPTPRVEYPVSAGLAPYEERNEMSIENCSVTDNQRNDILKLARECFSDIAYATTPTIMVIPSEIEAFYRAAFNAGIEAAANIAEHGRKTGAEAATAIRELRMKP